MQLKDGWYRAFGSAIRPMREAGVPLGTPPWEQTPAAQVAVPPVDRSTSDARLVVVALAAGLVLLALFGLAMARRRFTHRAL
jgi:hypothetical protein